MIKVALDDKKGNMIIWSILIVLIIAFIGFLSSIHVPYIQSAGIKIFTCFIVAPVSAIPLLSVIYKYLRRSNKTNIFFNAFRDKLALCFLVIILSVVFSLYVMAWPTYWFASKYSSSQYFISDAVVANAKYGYKLRVNEANGNFYKIRVSQNIYQEYMANCNDMNIPVGSFSWWAGSVIKESSIQKAISMHCTR